jgi:hypothetical protein
VSKRKMADNEHEGGSQPPSFGEVAPAAAAAARYTTGSAAASQGTASGSAAAEETAVEKEGSNQKESAHEALARLSKLKAQKQAPYWEFLEPVLVTETVDGALTYRRNFWQGHMSSKFPRMAAVAGRLLSARVTSCATERNWSLFGNIFSKTKNRLMLERAQKTAFIWGNSKESMGADEEFMLSEMDMLDQNRSRRQLAHISELTLCKD